MFRVRSVGEGFLVKAMRGPALCAALVACATARAQTASVATTPVAVDVVVTDASGASVKDLRREDFRVSEDGAAVSLSGFEAYAAKRTARSVPAANGTVADDAPSLDAGVWNVLVIDTLNTPMKQQAALRQEWREVVTHLKPGDVVAVVGLTDRLTLLKAFDDDGAALAKAMGHPLIARPEVLRGDAPANDAGLLKRRADVTASPDVMQAQANLRAFDARVRERSKELRVADTVDAFAVLARWLHAFPGHKNVLWLSGGFPQIAPDASGKNAYGAAKDEPAVFRQMVNAMGEARVSLCTIDVGAFAGGAGGTNSAANAAPRAMDAIAEATGGCAVHTAANVDDAVARAIASGTSGYALTYASANAKQDGELRKIDVALNGDASARGWKLSYRRAYFAPKAEKPGEDPEEKNDPITDDAAAAARARDRFSAALRERAGVPAVDIPFVARVSASGAQEDTLAPGNAPSPYGLMKGPYRRVQAQIEIAPDATMLTRGADGRWKGALEFTALVYNANGDLLNATGNTVTLALKDDTRERFLHEKTAMPLEVSVPVNAETYLRLLVRDAPGNRAGAVELPSASVSGITGAPIAPR